VVLPKIAPLAIEVTLGFGGVAKDYALPVHEIPPPPDKSGSGAGSARHDPHKVGNKMVGTGGHWKYLEEPWDKAKGGMLQRLADEVKSSTGLTV
jgi:hypothetical protein